MRQHSRGSFKKHLGNTDQTRFSKALRASERRYSKLIQGLPAAIYTCDPTGRVMLYNEAAVKLWGREPAVGKDLWCGSWRIYRTDGTTLPLDQCPMALAITQGRSIHGQEIVIERPDGARRYVLPHPQPIFDKSGNLVEAVNMLIDITEHRRTELALLESEERFRTMAEQAPNIIWMSDVNHNVIYLNTPWSDFTGLPAEKGFGQKWVDLIHPEDKETVLKDSEHAFENREPYSGKFRYKNAKAQYCVLNAKFSPRFSAHGVFRGYIGMLDDITIQENAKAALESIVEERTKDLIKLNADLKRSNLDLEQFAYVASHDLQEPLRKIQTFSNILQKRNQEKLNEESLSLLSSIASSANRLSSLIDDLLNFSRLSNPSTLFERSDLNEIWNKVKIDYELLLTTKRAVIHEGILPVVEAIPFQVSQLFYNLLGNSLKFSKEDRDPAINISCRKLSLGEVRKYPDLQQGVKHYEIAFSDNGIGFEDEYADQIFLIFRRLHGQSFYPGSGIGLALCQKIVNNHHGKIHAKGNSGEGSTFYVILPQTQPRKSG